MSQASDPSSTIGIPLEDAIDCFLKLELRDKWIRRLPDDEMNLIQWYLVEKQPCTPGLLKRAEDAFLRRAEMHQQRKDGERWVRKHVRRVKPPIETRTPVEWDDVESTHRIKSALVEIYSRAELERALQKRFGRLDEPVAADPAQAPATGTQPVELPPSITQPVKPTVAEPSLPKPVAVKRRRARPDEDRARAVINKRWPAGAPPQSELKNKPLHDIVLKDLAAAKPPQLPVSLTTTLRASGRRD